MDKVNTKINILGTEYKVEYRKKEQDKYLNDCDGYCDCTSKLIVVALDIDTNLDDLDIYTRKVLRHEIVHAFLGESGIQNNYRAESKYGHDENIVDWFAIQYPKINKVFKQLNIQEM